MNNNWFFSNLKELKIDGKEVYLSWATFGDLNEITLTGVSNQLLVS
jgi:hypothetical protein